MNRTTATVIIAGMILAAAVIVFALHSKGNVRASARVGAGSFNIETAEKQK